MFGELVFVCVTVDFLYALLFVLFCFLLFIWFLGLMLICGIVDCCALLNCFCFGILVLVIIGRGFGLLLSLGLLIWDLAVCLYVLLVDYYSLLVLGVLS